MGDGSDCPNLIQLGRWVAQVHDSVANLIAHNAGSCGHNCREANGDNLTKLRLVEANSPDWLKAETTWDKGQTVGHAMDAAVFWADQAVKAGWEGVDEDDWHHLEFQVGIIRDVVDSYISSHGCHPTVSATGGTGTRHDNIEHAAALVESAHAGVGNLIHNDTNYCDNTCKRAEADAIDKLNRATRLTPADVLTQRTWDHNQTVGHAYDASLWHLQTALDRGDDTSQSQWHEAEYQIGILRDVLAAAG